MSGSEPSIPLLKPKPARTLNELLASEMPYDGWRLEVAALQREGMVLKATVKVKDVSGAVIATRTATGQWGATGVLEWRF